MRITRTVSRGALAGGGLALAGFARFALPAIAVTRYGRPFLRPTTRVPSGVALTFDDGPAPESTPWLLDVLDEAGVKATFFLVGEQVVRCPRVAADVAARGHEIACHGYRHRNHLARRPSEMRRDLERARAIVEDACGVRVRAFRPPYGVFSRASWRFCDEVGWDRVLWSRWTRDWEEEATPEMIVRRATDGLTEGEIVLLHDADRYSSRHCYEATIAAVPEIVSRMRAAGLSTVTVTPDARL